MTLVKLLKMSVLERFQAMETLWDSLSREASALESPQWHEKILSDRKEKIESGSANFISLAELKSKHGQ